MKKNHRLLVAFGVLQMVGLYFLPMWSLTLEAPQYPGDLALGIKIHIDKIVGANETDLENINGLNHYIGMKSIQPDAIPELKIMPFVVAGLIVFGLIASLWGTRIVVYSWAALVCLAGGVGMYDFWKWEYDYGHNLDPRAIIKIPDMNYQPPLIGTKQLLNFTASSYPDIAFYLMIAGLAIAVATTYLSGINKLEMSKNETRNSETRTNQMDVQANSQQPARELDSRAPTMAKILNAQK